MVTKTINGRKYDYLYQSFWADGKSKSRFVRYLGRHVSRTKRELDALIKAEEGKP